MKKLTVRKRVDALGYLMMILLALAVVVGMLVVTQNKYEGELIHPAECPVEVWFVPESKLQLAPEPPKGKPKLTPKGMPAGQLVSFWAAWDRCEGGSCID